MKLLTFSSLFIILLSACSQPFSENSGNLTIPLLTGREISRLDREYTFSSKALTQTYLKKKLENLVNNHRSRLVKEIEYARYRGEAGVPFQALMTAEPALLTAINGVSQVIAEKAVNLPFANFLNGVSPTGLIAYYPLDGNTQDLSGNNQHGTGTALVSAPDKTGVSGRAYTFNGTSSKVVLPNFINNTWSQLTFSVWVKAAANSLRYPAFIGSNTATSLFTNQFLGIDTASQKLLIEIDTETGNYYTFGQNTVPANTWFHAVMVYDGTKLREYFNGVAGASVNANGKLKPVTNLQIGNISDNNIEKAYYKGTLDNIRIYNRALSAAEVQNLYNSGL